MSAVRSVADVERLQANMLAAFLASECRQAKLDGSGACAGCEARGRVAIAAVWQIFERHMTSCRQCFERGLAAFEDAVRGWTDAALRARAARKCREN